MVKRLTTLELHGLKTFATNTRLEFPGQVTAIVGPNGSGKSNIADSVRWVLGEQSYSTLRAKRTEDMIFSGSEQKSRAGMASATITFNNEDGWLPIDYSEVSISRRAYRDGQNEYLINGQKVRLKDVSELLSQTGLSERTYTIIGQGLVDVALALKPDERRKLFEEAAGIGLYRSRKEESLRRLETTRKNLDRVMDIMTEIKPRLRSLEKQASRYEEYQRLRADLHILLREWYGYHWNQKQQDLQNATSAYQDQEIRLGALRRKNSEAEIKVEEARAQLQINRKALEEAHRELSEYHRELEQASRELAIFDERQRSYSHQRGDLEIDLANVQQEIGELESQELSFKAEIDQRMVEVKAADDEVNQAEILLEEVSQKRAAAENNLESLRKKRIDLETQKVQISARVDELANRVGSLTQEATKIEHSTQKLDDEKVIISARVETSAETQTKTEQKSLELQSKLDTISKQLSAAETNRQLADQELAKQETRQAKLNAQLEVLNQAEAALSGYSEGSKTVVADSQKGRLPKGIEPLSKHLVVEEKYERAISAALGEFADLLLVPTSGRDVVIEYLESKENDRVALISTDQVQLQNNTKRLSKATGVLGFANDLIQVDAHYQNLVDQLFSDILVVSDRRSAQKIQPELVGSQKAVTLNGLVFQANGILISGQTASGKRLGRPRQQSEMQQELANLEKVIEEYVAQSIAATSTVQKLQQEKTSLTTELREQQIVRNEAQRNYQDAKDSLTRLDEQLEWHHSRLLEIQENITQTQGAIDSAEIKLEDYSLRIEALLGEENEILSIFNELPVFENQQTVNHWQTHRLVTQNALDTARQRYEDHHKRLEDAQGRLIIFQTRLAELENSLTSVKVKETDLRDLVSQINGSIEKIDTESINPFTDAVEEAENSVHALQKLEEHSHQQVIIAERQYTQLQLELSRKNDRLDNLRERIEDDFGLVAYDYEPKIDGPEPLPFDEGLIEDLPRVESVSESIEDDIKSLKNQVRRIGSINPEAQQEYYDVKERYEFLTNQIADLEIASKDLQEVIETLDGLMERDFLKTFKAVQLEFSDYFSRLFNGGEAKLMVSDEDNPVEGGVDIEARLPGRRRQGLALLSGGERSLTAVALIFALLKVSPTPFCILDEVDAMLDESNVGRFIDLLRDLSKKTQFVIITHNRNTVQAADVIYGVTMGRDSTSQMISLKLEEVDETYVE